MNGSHKFLNRDPPSTPHSLPVSYPHLPLLSLLTALTLSKSFLSLSQKFKLQKIHFPSNWAPFSSLKLEYCCCWTVFELHVSSWLTAALNLMNFCLLTWLFLSNLIGNLHKVNNKVHLPSWCSLVFLIFLFFVIHHIHTICLKYIRENHKCTRSKTWLIFLIVDCVHTCRLDTFYHWLW